MESAFDRKWERRDYKLKIFSSVSETKGLLNGEVMLRVFGCRG
jgi:hypothetical protein